MNTKRSVVSNSRKPEVTFEKYLGQFFQQRRVLSGISVFDATELLELADPQVLDSYENGTEEIPLETIFAMSNLYNIPPEDVLNTIYDLHGMHL